MCTIHDKTPVPNLNLEKNTGHPLMPYINDWLESNQILTNNWDDFKEDAYRFAKMFSTTVRMIPQTQKKISPLCLTNSGTSFYIAGDAPYRDLRGFMKVDHTALIFHFNDSEKHIGNDRLHNHIMNEVFEKYPVAQCGGDTTSMGCLMEIIKKIKDDPSPNRAFLCDAGVDNWNGEEKKDPNGKISAPICFPSHKPLMFLLRNDILKHTNLVVYKIQNFVKESPEGLPWIIEEYAKHAHKHDKMLRIIKPQASSIINDEYYVCFYDHALMDPKNPLFSVQDLFMELTWNLSITKLALDFINNGKARPARASGAGILHSVS